MNEKPLESLLSKCPVIAPDPQGMMYSYFLHILGIPMK